MSKFFTIIILKIINDSTQTLNNRLVILKYLRLENLSVITKSNSKIRLERTYRRFKNAKAETIQNSKDSKPLES